MLAEVASAAGRAAIHAIRVQIIPAPRSLADSREILRALRTYGDITTYRWLKHDVLSSAPNSAMAIFADRESMNRFLQSCPLDLEIDGMEREEAEAEEAEMDKVSDEETEFSEPAADATGDRSMGDELVRTDNGLTDTATYVPIAPPPTREPIPAQRRLRSQLFRIRGEPWRGKHKDWLERHPFWGNFKPDRRSIVAQDLGKRVPLVGLSDIDLKGKREIPFRILNRRKEDISKRPTLRDMIRDIHGEKRKAGKHHGRGPEKSTTEHWG